MKEQAQPEVRHALHDLNRYLSDQIAPLMVTDSLFLLMAAPPTVTAASIHAWATAQMRVGQDATMADLLFHGLRKIQLMAHLSLVPREPMTAWLESLGGVAIGLCPADERDGFAAMVRGLATMEMEGAGEVELLRLHGAPARSAKSKGGEPADGAPVSGAAARGLRRFALMMERLDRLPPEPARREAALSQALGLAAMHSETNADLDQYFRRLSHLGVEPRTDQLFRALAASMPAWIVPEGAGAAMTAVSASRPATAMQRLLTMAGSMEEARKRYSELIDATIEQFNQGQLVRAAAMIEVAERVLADRQIDPDSAKVIRSRAQDRVSEDVLRRFSEQPDKHGRLRRVMSFFPALSVAGLLESLDGQAMRERRKWLMALLEAHGPEARRMAFDQASALASNDPDPNGWYLRNLICLLRRIPMPPGTGPDREVALLARLARHGNPHVVIKETLGALGTIRGPRAEKALIDVLHENEAALLEGGLSPADEEEFQQLLDRAASALAWQGTSNALRTVANHAFRAEPALGNTIGRLADLGGQDLSHDKDLTGRLVASLRAELPRKVLGFTVQKKSPRVIALVQALSGTPSSDVKGTLREVAERFPGEEFGVAASRALASFAEGSAARQARDAAARAAAAPGGAARRAAAESTAAGSASHGVPAPESASGREARAAAPGGHQADQRAAAASAETAQPAPALSGDLELFALPTLVQTVADARMSGVLTLSGKDGIVQGSVTFEEGRIRACAAGPLAGEDAFFQMFERPGSGSFAFRAGAVSGGTAETTAGGSGSAAGEPLEVLPAMLEGMRRYDELQQARGVVPDDASLAPTQVKPTAPPGEEDKGLLKAVWREAARGATPAACEGVVPVDAYRIRRLYVHWLEQGALQLAA